MKGILFKVIILRSEGFFVKELTGLLSLCDENLDSSKSDHEMIEKNT